MNLLTVEEMETITGWPSPRAQLQHLTSANAYGNVENRTVMAIWSGCILSGDSIWHSGDVQTMTAVLKKHGIPFFKRRIGWNKSGLHYFIPKFSGIAISIMDLPKLLNVTRPPIRVEMAIQEIERYVSEHCDPVYSNDDH